MDAIWKTCCALHNWLLEVDGPDKEWEHGVPSVREGKLGQFDQRDQATQEAFALQQFWCHTTIHNYDLSQMGESGNLADDLADNHDDDDTPCRGKINRGTCRCLFALTQGVCGLIPKSLTTCIFFFLQGAGRVK
jgi:hypothetical protein